MRYFNGTEWTEHVSSHGRAGMDPPGGGSHVPTVQRAPEKVQRDVQRAGKAGVAALGFQLESHKVTRGLSTIFLAISR